MNIPPILNAPSAPEQTGRTNRRDIAFRLLVASCVWLAVSGLSIYVAWENTSQTFPLRPQQWVTQFELERTAEAIKKYQEKFNASPRSYDELRVMTNDVPSQVRGVFRDAWGRPFLFSYDGTNCLVSSLGRDGTPGGLGLDCDLTSTNWEPKESQPTVAQFFCDMPTRGMTVSCFVCGGLAFLLCLFIVKTPDLTRSGLAALVGKLVATVIGAIMVAGIISALHIPSGH